MKRVHEFICDVCGKHKRHEDDVSTGYGTIGNFKACFECCGKEENAERSQKPVKSITITIEWKKSRTWGMNPNANAQVEYKDGTYDTGSASASGCGYDKESTVIRE